MLKELENKDDPILNGDIAKWTKRDVNDLIQDLHKIYGWRKRVADASSIDFPYDLRVTG